MIAAESNRTESLDRKFREMSERAAKMMKADRRKRTRRAPGDHPWRQYSMAGIRKNS